ncbi:hypothetical protein, partial [Microbispora sp. ATCC PTA-5024]|uniref:hypothetical protein n=1 Tax=Microbispora sp. ATCC PTA-5024 TaxID=316330 RepID=UPI001E303F0F
RLRPALGTLRGRRHGVHGRRVLERGLAAARVGRRLPCGSLLRRAGVLGGGVAPSGRGLLPSGQVVVRFPGRATTPPRAG